MIEDHHFRYEQLQRNRLLSQVRDQSGRSNLTLRIDGRCIRDIPDFYLQLGELVNGPGGYFGASLDALDDCLCGGFGLTPPLTIVIDGWTDFRERLGTETLKLWWEATTRRAADDEDLADAESSTSEARERDHERSYAYDILEVLHDRGVTVILPGHGDQ